jgi:hypothetical protein
MSGDPLIFSFAAGLSGLDCAVLGWLTANWPVGNSNTVPWATVAKEAGVANASGDIWEVMSTARPGAANPTRFAF